MDNMLNGMVRNNFPALFDEYKTTYGNKLEWVGWMLWHKVVYTSAVTVQLPFFTVAPANIEVGNMELAGQLSSPQAFFIRAIRIRIDMRPESTTAAATGNVQTGALDDMIQLLEHGVLQLSIGRKVYGLWPCWCLPAGGGLVPFMQTGDIDVVIDIANNGVADPRAVYSLTKPLFIPPQMNFRVDIFWPNGPYTLVAGNPNICVMLDGDMVRPVQ